MKVGKLVLRIHTPRYSVFVNPESEAGYVLAAWQIKALGAENLDEKTVRTYGAFLPKNLGPFVSPECQGFAPAATVLEYLRKVKEKHPYKAYIAELRRFAELTLHPDVFQALMDDLARIDLYAYKDARPPADWIGLCVPMAVVNGCGSNAEVSLRDNNLNPRYEEDPFKGDGLTLDCLDLNRPEVRPRHREDEYYDINTFEKIKR
jgi:hypothetical protein